MGNIVLIGMPSCGKTTVGNILAEKLNREFFDSDNLVATTENTNIPISAFFGIDSVKTPYVF